MTASLSATLPRPPSRTAGGRNRVLSCAPPPLGHNAAEYPSTNARTSRPARAAREVPRSRHAPAPRPERCAAYGGLRRAQAPPRLKSAEASYRGFRRSLRSTTAARRSSPLTASCRLWPAIQAGPEAAAAHRPDPPAGRPAPRPPPARRWLRRARRVPCPAPTAHAGPGAPQEQAAVASCTSLQVRGHPGRGTAAAARCDAARGAFRRGTAAGPGVLLPRCHRPQYQDNDHHTARNRRRRGGTAPTTPFTDASQPRPAAVPLPPGQFS